jgi:large subunit ribosomal protein L4
MIALPIFNQKGKQVNKIELDPVVFDGRVNQDILYQAVLMYRAARRRGLASTLTRGEVSGGGRKPWRQKGTGRARVGSSRSPLWRKGGVVFGPHPRNYGFSLPKKIKISALKSSLNAKLNEDSLIILDELKIDAPKTKEAVKLLSNFKLGLDSKTILLMLDEINNDLKLSFRNIGFLDVVKASNSNAYDVLKAQKLIINLNGLKILVDRIKKEIS